MNASTSAASTKTVFFTMGGPGAGKSYVLRTQYPALPVLDMDAIKEALPGYDPENPHLVHRESSQIAAREYFARLGTWNESFCYDGTGTNVDKYIRFIDQAREAGWKTHLIFVDTPIEVAYQRNQDRARVVSDEVFFAKHEAVKAAFAVLSKAVDGFTTV